MESTSKIEYIMQKDYDEFSREVPYKPWGHGRWTHHVTFGLVNSLNNEAALKSFNLRLLDWNDTHHKYFRLIKRATTVIESVLS